MRIALVGLCNALELELVEQANAWSLSISKPEGLTFNVTVPHDVLEWYVDATDDSGEIWNDWGEYYSIDGEKREQLSDEMARDIECCVTILVNSEVRISHDAKSVKRIELKSRAGWRVASLSWMTNPSWMPR